MDKLIKSLLLGTAAGILNVIPLVFLGLSWGICIGTLLHWLGLGLIVTYAKLPLNGAVSGAGIALLTGIPLAIFATDIATGAAIPILISSLVMGYVLGFMTERLITNQPPFK